MDQILQKEFHIYHQENHKKYYFFVREKASDEVEILWVMFFIGEGVLKRQKVLNQ
jgi:hypothetical protein